jgi:hypothetical protein
MLNKVHKKLLFSQLSKDIFWSGDKDALDLNKNKDCIIRKIIETGRENDEIIMWKLYSYHIIKKIALDMEYMDYDRLSYISFVLKIRKEKFKCFLKKPWNVSY